MQAIIIGTTTSRIEPLTNILQTLKGFNDYPIIVVTVPGYEPAKIKWVLNNTNLDEFIFLQDTIEVKNVGVFDLVFNKYKGKTVAFNDKMKCFLVKYTRRDLEKTYIKDVDTKTKAIEEERELYRRYPKDNLVIVDNMADSEVFIEKFNRVNMVVENQYFKKFKGTWTRNQLK